MESKRRDELFNAMSVAGVAVVALFLLLLFKVKGGLLGLVLGVVAVATLVYWLREMRSLFRGGAHAETEVEFFYDLLDEGEALIFVAKVPGPADEVEARLYQGYLMVSGGGNFSKAVKVPDEAMLEEKSYTNGVLHVTLRKMKGVSGGNPRLA